MSQRDTIVIGASAGGVEALRVLLAGLPAGFPARVLVVLHIPAGGVNTLASVLARSSAMEVRSAGNRDRLEPGVILVAPPDHHLVIVDDACLLTQGPRDNGHRPSIDVLFRSAASALGPRTIGVILSGALDDGAIGLRAIHERGGLGLVQHPDDAQHASMPRHAITVAAPQYVVPVAEMPALLLQLIGSQAGDVPDDVPHDALHDVLDAALEGDPHHPDLNDEQAVKLNPMEVTAEHRVAVEVALWMALRVLDEKAALCHDMSGRAGAGGASISAQRFAEQASDASEAADVLRDLLASRAGSARTPEGGQLA